MAPAVTSDLQDIHHAETKAAARAAIEVFKEKYEVKYGPAVACLTKDAEAMLTFFDFPAEHWDHLRMSNPPLGDCRQSPAGQRVENVFATVRHRTVPTKGAVSQKTVKPMVFTLIRAASKTWRRLNGAKGRLRHQRRQIHRRSRKHRSRQNQRRFITPRHPNSCMAPWSERRHPLSAQHGCVAPVDRQHRDQGGRRKVCQETRGFQASKWRKVHLGIDADTLEIRAIEGAGNRVGDVEPVSATGCSEPARDAARTAQPDPC